MFARALKLLVLVVVLPGLGLSASPAAQGPIYDASADYEAGWLAGHNPNGVWRYGWTEGLTGPLTLYTHHYIPEVHNNMLHMWNDPDNSLGWTPWVGRNAGEDYDDGNVTWTAGALMLSAGGVDSRAYSRIIWTAPAAGTYSLAATFFAQQNNIWADVHILVNGASVFDDTITQNGVSLDFAGEYTLQAGDTIDFAVGYNGAYYSHPGTTGLDAVITALPEFVGGTVTGVTAQRVVCLNVTTRQRVVIELGGEAPAWNCEAAGLVVHAGDRIFQTIDGTANGNPVARRLFLPLLYK
jgi:hypothetical protein